MRVQAGELRERVQLQTRAAGVDAHGQPNGAWSTVATVWARRRLLSAREFFAAAQTQQEGTVEYVIRYLAVATSQRLVWLRPAEAGGNVNHDIVSADSPDRAWTVILAKQGVKDGR